MATKAKVPMKGNNSATKDDTDMLHLPCKIVVRKASASRAAEAYMIQNSTKPKYIAGLRANKTAQFESCVQELVDLANGGSITRVSEAKAWLMERGSRD
eukprot:10034496-Alexandrium_andersonii.AAC.1